MVLGAPSVFFVPNKVSVGPDDAGIVLTINISCVDAVDEEDDLNDSSYVESDEDMAMSDEDDLGNS
jgi:E3 ubiquitin-protein ligase SIAH1